MVMTEGSFQQVMQNYVLVPKHQRQKFQEPYRTKSEMNYLST